MAIRLKKFQFSGNTTKAIVLAQSKTLYACSATLFEFELLMYKKSITKISVLFGLYFAICGAYALFSYCLVHPNLVLINWPIYWQFQNWIWQTLFNNRPLLVNVYVVILFLFFVIYGKLLFYLKKRPEQFTAIMNWRKFGFYLVLVSPLLLSYNA